MKKLNFLVAIVAVVLAVSTSAFKPVEKPTDKAFSTYWVFMEDTIEEAFSAGNYQEDAQAQPCSTGNQLPCRIPHQSSDPGDFQLYLDSFEEDDVALLGEISDKKN